MRMRKFGGEWRIAAIRLYQQQPSSLHSRTAPEPPTPNRHFILGSV
jgi:hypothetical protein